MPGEKKTNKEVTYAAASSSWKLNEKSNQHVGVARSGKWGSVRSQELQVRVEATEVFPLQPSPPDVAIEVGNACQVSSRAAKRKCLTPTPVHKHVHYVAILSSPKHTHTHTHTHAGRKMKNRVQVEEERGAFLGLVFLGKLAAN